MIRALTRLRRVCFLLVCSLPFFAVAQSERLSIHGFAAQGMLLSEDNNFIVKDDLNLHLTELGVNASYQFNKILRLAGQVAYIDRGGRVEQGGNIDYMFLDFSLTKNLDRQFNVYLGRFKNSDWLYSDVIDIPHARPSIFLPQSLYQDAFREISIGATGASVKYNHAFEEGDTNFTLSIGEPNITSEFSRSFLNRESTGVIKEDYTLNGSLYWNSEDGNWRLGVSYFGSENRYQRSVNDLVPVSGELSVSRYIFSGVLNGAFWELASELSAQKLEFRGDDNQVFNQKKNPTSAYVQARFFVDNNWTVITRLDHYDVGDEEENSNFNLGRTPGYFDYQTDLMMGFSYRFNRRWLLQAEYHAVKGTALISPLFFREVNENDKKHWEIWALQVSYKF